MTLEYAPDGLIGVLTPQANTTVEPEFGVLVPPGLAIINARLTSPKTAIEERLLDYLDTLDAAAAQFANAPLGALAFACTGASYLAGRERESALVARLETQLGIAVRTAALAVVASLRLLGARRIGLVSCYPEALTQASAAYWRSHGFGVAEIARAYNAADSFHPIYSLNGAAALRALATLRTAPLDAIVMLGTGMPTLGPLAAARGWAGPPVTSCTLSLAWAAIDAALGRTPDRARLEAWLAGAGWAERFAARHPAATLPALPEVR